MLEVKSNSVYLGCDPEFFFSKNGQVLGSEKFLPKKGLDVMTDYQYADNEKVGKVTIDGVQAEINPEPETCREDLANNISNCFKAVKAITVKNKRLKINFAPTIEVKKKEFDSLCDDSKKFGCASSQNQYTGKESVIVANAKEDMSRSAGGHLHFGFKVGDLTQKKLLTKEPNRIVPMLDLLVGNTAVLLDRNEGNIARRKNYGRAGEYRLPKHGLEYRTLSNFWLGSYQLYSLMTGLGRYAINVCASSTKAHDIEKMFMRQVDMKKVERAINQNDFELAYENFFAIEDVIMEVTDRDDHFPLHSGNMRLFHHFVAMGTDYWFKENPLEHWIKLRQGTRRKGISDYLQTVVSADYDKKMAKRMAKRKKKVCKKIK